MVVVVNIARPHVPNIVTPPSRDRLDTTFGTRDITQSGIFTMDA